MPKARSAALAMLFLCGAGAAAAQPADPIARLSCAEASQAGIAQQAWRRGGSPFGLAYEKWTERDFDALRARVAACAPRDAGLRQYVGLLDAQQKSAVGRLSPAEAQEQTSVRDIQTRLDGIPVNANSFDELTALCTELRRTMGQVPARMTLLGMCLNKLEAVKLAKARADEGQAQQQSRIALRRIVAQIEAMPPTPETIRTLREMLKNYRRPELDFTEQNTLYMYLERKLAPLERQMVDHQCKSVADKAGIPAELEGAVIDDPPVEISLVRFVCAAMLAKGSLVVRPKSDNRYDISVDGQVLTFELGRLLRQRPESVFVAQNSPLSGGVKALRLVDLSGPNGKVPLRRGLVTLIDAQHGPALSAYLKQLGASLRESN